MEKKNIYIILAFLIAIMLSFSAWYYFWVKLWVFETERKYDEYLRVDLNNFSGNILEDIEKKYLEEKSPDEFDIDLSFDDKNFWILENMTTEPKNIFKIEKKDEQENMEDYKNFEKIDYFGYDFWNDESLQKFVNSKISFNNLKYVPKNLVKISSDYLIDTKGNQTLRSEAKNALEEMGKKFFEEKWEKIKVVSAYRSYDYQVWIKKWGCPDNLCAKAGFSEHQTGLAVDLWSASNEQTWKNDKKLSEYFSWLNENAHDFGFHNTYQKWISVDGYDVEPWHWRYVWVQLANYLKKSNITIAEYFNENF